MLPKDTLKVIIKKGCIAYLPGIDFIVKQTYQGQEIYNVRIPNGSVIVEYYVDKCMCQRRQLWGKVTSGILFLDE